MKSNDVSEHRLSDRSAGQAKKPWITPVIEIIAFQNAAGAMEGGIEGTGSHRQVGHS